MEIHNIIDSARDILVGKLPNPQDQIDTITYTLMYKFMSDIDDESASLGGKRVYFQCDYEKYGWHNLMRADGQQQLILFRDAIESMSRNPNLPQLFREIFSGALLKFNDPRTLRLFLKEMDKFTHGENDDLGDAYEYLLSIMSSQGGLGQFRTPRHIIEFIVQLVNPDKEDKIIDPACGTSGFLISAYKHIMAMYDGKDSNGKQNNEQRLTAQELERIHKNFRGFDIDPTMIRTARVNMYLHGFKTPDIIEHDTLTSEDFWNERYDVILANPPFMTPKGGIQPHKKFSVQAKRSEVLFTDYIATHLKPRGRAGFIVPEGIIFQSGNAYKQLRKNLVENSLYAVVSLPGGVFQPYSGVKTSILILDNELAKQRDDILFIKIANDGFSLGAQRRPIAQNDLPAVLRLITNYKLRITNEDCGVQYQVVKKNEIAQSGDYNLAGDRYTKSQATSTKYEMVKLGEVFSEIKNGKNVEQFDKPGKYKVSRIQTIAASVVNLDATKNTNDEVAENDFLQKGDILFSHINSIDHLAKTAIFNEDEKVVHGANLLRLRADRTKVLPEYALMVFKGKVFLDEAKKYAQKAVNQASINSTNVKKLLIPLPPLSVQKEIVEQVSAKQRTIEAARAIMNLELRITKAEIGEDFQMMKLEEVAEKVANTILPETISGNVNYIGLENIESNTGKLLGEIKTLAKTIKSAKNKFIENQILYGKLRPNLNKVYFSEIQGICSTDIFVLQAKETVLPKYLSSILRDKDFNDNVLKGLKGAQLPRVDWNFMQQIQIPVPSLSIQEKIVSKYTEIEQIKKGNMRLVEILEEEIKALINELIG